MSRSGYWSRLLHGRLSRRRTLAGFAGGGAALALAACGGGEGSSGDETGGSALVSLPTDSTSRAKPGGVLKHFASGDALHLDPLSSSAANVVNYVSPYAYPRLLKWVNGTYPEIADGLNSTFVGGAVTEPWLNWWIDTTKPPLARA